jgi:hypothetical protein
MVIIFSCTSLKRGGTPHYDYSNEYGSYEDETCEEKYSTYGGDEFMTADRVYVLENSAILISKDNTPNKINPPANMEKELRVIKVENTKVLSSALNQGYVIYKIPNEMSVRNTYQILVRISKSNISLYENINGVVRVSNIPVTQTMEVKLVDPSPSDAKVFDIISDNEAQQIIDNGDEFTQWSWNVTPLKTGESKIKVVISVIKEGNKKEVVYEDSVTIKMNLGKQLPFFFTKYWQWLLTTLIVPFGVWYYNKRRKKDEGNNKKQA